jgi:uncharacterized protein with GYD domain
VLANFTDQGANIRDTTKRADAVKELAKKVRVTAKEFYWTMGACDVVVIFDAPDDAAMTALSAERGVGRQRSHADDARVFQRRTQRVIGKLG